MSLTTLTKDDAQSKLILDLILPNEKIQFGRPLLLPALTKNAAIVGTAFDYLMRFEMERRFRDVTANLWVAEVAILRLRAHFQEDVTSATPFPARGATMDEQMANRWMGLVADARTAVSSFTKLAAPAREELLDVARYAFTLARIDLLHRARYVDDKVGIDVPADREDCVRLLEAVPWRELVLGLPILLNPTFGLASKRVGGADADAISGGRLIDFKVIKTVSPPETLRQLVGYLILSREARLEDPTFPEITELVAYYARHRHVEVLPASRFTRHPRFIEVCRLFLDRADQIRSVRQSLVDVLDDDVKVQRVEIVGPRSPRQVWDKGSKPPKARKP